MRELRLVIRSHRAVVVEPPRGLQKNWSLGFIVPNSEIQIYS